MTNGQPLVIRAAKKPISTLRKPLESVNLDTKQPEAASYERSDVCAVPAASVILENVVAFEVAAALVEKFGGDSLAEMQARWKLFHEMARAAIAQEFAEIRNESRRREPGRKPDERREQGCTPCTRTRRLDCAAWHSSCYVSCQPSRSWPGPWWCERPSIEWPISRRWRPGWAARRGLPK